MLALFSAAALTGAFLLFWMEPLFARLVLPMLGGAPAVWNTCLMFFQTLLLLGYLYAHASTRYLSPKRQVILHVALLALCFITLPIGIPRGWTPPASGNVIPWLVMTLTAAVGLPFFVLSATAPLLQKWLANFETPVENPYVLYAASNAGSFLGLLAFPLLLEPALTLRDQSRWWLVVFIVALGLLSSCGALAWKRMRASVVIRPGETAEVIPWAERIRWIALAFVPSSLLLSVTTYLSTDIAATPLLWVIPLSLYLLTFVIVFARSGQKLAIGAEITHTLLITILAYVLFRHTSLGFRVGYLFHLGLFTVTALVLHGELAASRPSPAKLTEYYLWISLGGALGGIFAAIVVPLLFQSTRDYTLMLVIGMLLRLFFRNNKAHNQLPLVAVPALLLAAAGFSGKSRETIFSDRSFFGIYRVTLNAGPSHVLYHGSTIHGAQFLKNPLSPVTYYHPNGPVGAIFQKLQVDRTDRNVGVVGLGTGSILCYSRPREHWTFFEIDAHVEKIAKNPRLFSYLTSCAIRPRVVLGDARLTLAREPAGRYALLVLDAFSSDAIPVHLLTREAMRVYDQVLEEHGILMIHISNRRLDLEPVVSGLADDAGMFGLVRDDNVPNERQDKNYEYSSTWVALARNRDDLAAITGDGKWRPLVEAPHQKVWTDDYSNILSVIKW